nr:1,4-dihydroxy-6-naphthoate synthase [Deltaproteobacteria bacterium]
MIPIDVGFSSCPNDTFMFHAMLHGCIATEPFCFVSHIEDIETLNQHAAEKLYHLTKLSFFAYLHLHDAYTLLDAGAALGYGCGPVLVARSAELPLSGITVAIPGWYTTAHLLLKLWNPSVQVTVTRFDEILPGLASGRYDAGVIIHEGRFVYPSYQCVKVVDLGVWWETETGLPIPLGCIAVRNDAETIQHHRLLETVLRRSVEYAFGTPSASRSFVKQYAQELEDSVIDEHIALYVNEFSLSLGETGRKAVHALEEMARCRNILP